MLIRGRVSFRVLRSSFYSPHSDGSLCRLCSDARAKSNDFRIYYVLISSLLSCFLFAWQRFFSSALCPYTRPVARRETLHGALIEISAHAVALWVERGLFENFLFAPAVLSQPFGSLSLSLLRLNCLVLIHRQGGKEVVPGGRFHWIVYSIFFG